MPRHSHIALWLAALVGIFTIATAEPPLSPVEPSLSPGEPPWSSIEPPWSSIEPPWSSIEPPLSSVGPPFSPLEQGFRDALEGRLPSGETGNGVFDDLVSVIRKQGSVLDGSSLDPKLLEDDANVFGNTTAPADARSENAHAAEQLLKASRLLEQIGSTAIDRSELIANMRVEAGKLLSE